MEDIIWRWTQWWGDWKQKERIKALVDEAALFAMTMLADACARKLIRFQVTCDKKVFIALCYNLQLASFKFQL